MSKVSIVFLVVAMLLLNNIVLLYFHGNDHENRQETSKPISDQGQVNNQQPLLSENIDKAKSFAARDVELPNSKFVESYGEIRPNVELAVVEFMDSPEFFDLLDKYRKERQVQQKSTQQQYQEKTTGELLGLLDADLDERETAIVQQLLYQRDLSELGPYDLKQLYLNEGVGRWTKAKALSALLYQDDDQALAWAKEFVVTEENEGNFNYDLIQTLYDADRDFFVNQIEEMSLKDIMKTRLLDNILYLDNDLASRFLEKNIDEILELNSSDVYQRLGNVPINFELSRDQEASIGDLLFSKKSSSRSFALRMAANISDIDVLRRGFEGLKNSQEQITFVYSLIRDTEKKEHVELAKELGAELDDLIIRQSLQALP